MKLNAALASLLLAALGCVLAPGQDGSKEAAVLRDFSGRVFLTAPEGGFEIQLKPGRDFKKALQEGARLRCDSGASARVEYFHGSVRIVTRTVTASDKSYRVHIDRPLTERQRKVIAALRGYGDAGASREIGHVVWSPPREGLVRVSTASIRWNPRPGLFTLALINEVESKIWSAVGIDASAGRLSAEQETSFQKTIARVQDTETREMRLTISSDLLREDIPFSVLSTTAEKALDRELQLCDEELSDPLLRLVGRGQILAEAKILVDASEEFEKALAIEPQSESLLRAAASTARQAGNVVRSVELDRQLQSLGR